MANGKAPELKIESNGKKVAIIGSGYCKKGEDITVKLRGGDLVINYTDDGVQMTGSADTVFTGVVEI